ncbi:MAG TPA: beta-ketoacyl synthase N-terminal-like domain-containing protein [Chitinivibrionales bacterium]|nr:beta-ketoacyl synthase N-terminal-like domain-containing protein [Chitinivibrionales bacterium]
MMQNALGITSVGVILPAGTGLAALRPAQPASSGRVMLVLQVPAIEGISKNDMRRMSKLTRFSLFAGRQAAKAADFSPAAAGLFVGLTHGSTSHLAEFHDYLFDYGPDKASPNSFSNGVTNASLSNVSAFLKLTAGGTTILGYENNGLDVLNCCCQNLSDGEYNVCLAGSSEEYSEVVHGAYRACGWFGEKAPAYLPWPRENGEGVGIGISEGGAFFVLEPLSRYIGRKPLCSFSPVNIEEFQGGADVVISGAGAGMQDVHELRLLERLGKKNAGKKPALLFSKPVFGETFGLGAMLSCLMACDIVASSAVYPQFPVHPSLKNFYDEQQRGPAQSVLVAAAGRNGQTSAGMIYSA